MKKSVHSVFVCLSVASCWLVASNSILEADVLVQTIRIPMRDGILLSTDIYREQSVDKAAVVLMRTPYDKNRAKATAERFAAAGYIAVVQDCRGKFESEGAFVPYNNEGQDGFDTIEWLYRQTWCSGRIGMWGSSYVGATQWQAAVEGPPGLVTITPTATFSSFYRNLYQGGAVRLALITRWASGNSTIPVGAVAANDWDQMLMHLPLSEFDQRIGWPIPWLTGMLTHTRPDGYWTRLDMTRQITELDLPIQHVVGYYDFFSRESVGNFVRMQHNAVSDEARQNQQLILGPWDHGTIGKSLVGELDFGQNAIWDSAGATLEWFDRFLKQDPAVRARPLPPVRYFLMGANEWRESSTWPPCDDAPVSFFLHSDGKANTRSGDGRIDRSAPATDEPMDVFKADPSDPVPASPVTSQRPLNAAVWGPADQQITQDRSDVLVYTSEPLTEPLTFAGNPVAELFVSADTPDADWVVKLTEVYPDGRAINLAVGIQRGSFRDSELNPLPLVPGEVTRIRVDLGPVAAQLKTGHRLRVDICGACFPLYDRNTNTGEGPFGKTSRISSETVRHTVAMPSRILLPCLAP